MAKKQQQESPKWDKAKVKESLLKIEGVSEDIANHAAVHGVVDDVYVVQSFYRVSGTTAEAMIKTFKESIK